MTPLADILAVVTPQIGSEEGCRLAAYLDTRGIPTIGWGRADAGVHLGMTCTQGEADAWRDQKLTAEAAELDAQLPWWRTLDPVRAAVILEMAYQMGTSGLMAFHQALGAMQAGKWATAAADMLASDWAQQTPARARREATQMRTGVVA